jgi:DNA-binding CsgD family transcriptional regulator
MGISQKPAPAVLAELMADLYAVLDEQGTFEAFLWKLAQALTLDACSLVRIGLKGRSQLVEAAVGYDEELRRRLRVLVGAEPMIRDALGHATPGSLWLDSDFRDRVAFRETRFWRRWLVPQGFRGWGCVVVERSEIDVIYLEFLARAERLPFGPGTLRLLKALAPHLRRVGRVKSWAAFGPTVGATARAPEPRLRRGSLSRIPTPFELMLRQRYMLTPAEARLAAALATGVTLKTAAERLYISLNTARTHLARVYDKTGVRRQAELLLVLMRGQTEAAGTDAADALAGAARRAGTA